MRVVPIGGLFFLLLKGLLTGCGGDEYAVTECREDGGLELNNDEAPLYGDPASPIEVTLFVDFQCPPSAVMAIHIFSLLNDLERDGKSHLIKLRVRHFASPSHNRARAAAIAAAAAHRQGDVGFFNLFFHLFKNGSKLGDEDILLYAELAELDLVRFQADMADPASRERVDGDFELAVELGLDATPGVLICGHPVEADPAAVVDNLEFLVEEEI